MKIAATVVLLFGLLVAPGAAAAHGATPFAFSTQSIQLGNPVEQETPCYPSTCFNDPSQWVVNPTACIWDVDDNVIEFGSGDLAGNASASVVECVMADGRYFAPGDDPHVLGVDAYASSPNLAVQLSTSADNADNQANVGPAWDAAAKAYRYHWCAPNGVDPPGPFPTVAGSNGGYGYVDDVTLSVSNPGGHTVRGVRVWLGVGAAAYYQVDCPRTWAPQ